MERLTHRETPENKAYVDRGLVHLSWYSMDDDGWCGEAIERLATIEDILGDTYDLDHLRGLAQAERDGRLVVITSPDSSENAVLAAVFRGDDPPAVMHGGGDLDDLLALTHLLVSYTAEVCKIGYDELCLGLSTMEPTTKKAGPEK